MLAQNQLQMQYRKATALSADDLHKYMEEVLKFSKAALYQEDGKRFKPMKQLLEMVQRAMDESQNEVAKLFAAEIARRRLPATGFEVVAVAEDDVPPGVRAVMRAFNVSAAATQASAGPAAVPPALPAPPADPAAAAAAVAPAPPTRRPGAPLWRRGSRSWKTC